jgi:hypothetical protein
MRDRHHCGSGLGSDVSSRDHRVHLELKLADAGYIDGEPPRFVDPNPAREHRSTQPSSSARKASAFLKSFLGNLWEFRAQKGAPTSELRRRRHTSALSA